jgi:C4-dicarboxylate-specific signal transduction histidine kinase
MSKWGKGIGLALIIFLVLVVLFNIFNKPRNTEDKQLATYKEYMEKQEIQNAEYMRKLNAHLSRVEALNERVNQDQNRFEKLLERWEKQADRYDALLSKWERQGE